MATKLPPALWVCPVCGQSSGRVRWEVNGDATEGGVDAVAFRPSADRFGATAATVVTCSVCGHGSLARPADPDAVTDAYAAAADPVSFREEAGQVETARRGLARVEQMVRPGSVVDVGCWTGSFLVAAAERGWQGRGIEPSTWAAERALARGVEVDTHEFEAVEIPAGSCRLVVMCDVLEHLADPGAALERVGNWIEPGGALYLTVPDAGSVLARAMGRRWWSVLPMHVQYFTRVSLGRLLAAKGFEVRGVRSHAKVFTSRYYAERLGGYSSALESAAFRLVDRLGQSERLVAPDFHDRMEVIATRP